MSGTSSVVDASSGNVTAKNVVIGGGTIQTNENNVADQIDNTASSSSIAESASKQSKRLMKKDSPSNEEERRKMDGSLPTPDATSTNATTVNNYNIYNARNVATSNAVLTTNENNVRDEVHVSASSSSTVEFESKENIQIPKWFAKINQDSWSKSLKNLLDEFEDKGLNNPKEVHPQMKWIERYYQGEYKNQLIKERGFVAYDENKEESNLYENFFITLESTLKAKEVSNLTMDSLIETFSQKCTLKDEDNIPVTAIMASAGSGKTTMLRRMVKRMMENNGLIKSKNYLPSTDSLFDVIHYIELASKTYSKSTTLAKFLFGGYFNEQSDVEKAYEHLCQNQTKFILCFDGLDQAPWDLTNKSMRDIRPHEKADSATIMYNLLSRNLLPHVRIVITSREFKISTLPGKSKPKHIIALTGLKFEDVKTLFESLLKPNGEKYWKRINEFSRRLLRLMSTPLFLILSAIVTARYPDLPPPTTITELFCRIMYCLPQSDNIQERDQIFQVVTKLKVLAHQIMEEGKVVFKEVYLNKKGLKMEDVRDLVMKIPGNNILTRHLMDGSSVLCFCHQSFQEFFSASHISEMSLENFQNFSKSYLMSDQWTVVCWFTCGIIFGPDSDDLHKVCDRERKQAILKENLLSELKDRRGGYKLLNLLMAIYETNDDQMLRSCPKILDMAFTPLNSDQVHLLSSFMVKRKEIRMLNLHNCGLNDELMKVMSSNLKDSDVHIEVLKFHEEKRIASINYQRSHVMSLEHLNFFLRNLNVDEVECRQNLRISDFLKWKNVSRLKFWGMLFSKTESLVQIQHDLFTGSFDTKEKKIVISRCQSNPNVIHKTFRVMEICETNTLSIDKVWTKQYLTLDDVQKLNSIIGTFTIPDILLSVRETPFRYVFMIERFVDRFQVEILDIAIHHPTSRFSADEFSSLKQQCRFRTHGYFNAHDTSIIYQYINSNVDENVRIVLYCRKKLTDRLLGPALYDDIVELIKNCKQKVKSVCFVQLTDDMLTESHKRLPLQPAKKLGIEFEYRIKEDVPNDAWYECDFGSRHICR